MARPGRFLKLLPLLLFTVSPAQSASRDASPPGGGEFACGRAATPVSAIQGAGSASPMAGSVVEVEAIVVGVFQGADELKGLFVQEEDSDRDRDEKTSEGLFAHTSYSANIGDLVRLRGTVTEFEGLTELHPVTRLLTCPSRKKLPTPAVLRLPIPSSAALEAIENMSVILPQRLVISDNYHLWEYGELVASSKRLVQPTQVSAPGGKALRALDATKLDRLVIDDGRMGRNLLVASRGEDNATPFSAGNTLRGGQEISGLAGVMHFAFGHYRLQPTRPFIIEAGANPRTTEPAAVGGTLRISTFNVFNFFSSPDQSGPVCGATGNQQCRGAHTPAEQKRQLEKLVSALSRIDADAFALLELENNAEQSLRDIADALNAHAGSKAFAYVPSGILGRDAIKVGILFKPASLTMEGHFAVLDHNVDARFDDSLNRPALAQAFRSRGTGEVLTVVATHLKSKNCLGSSGPDANQNDGQACYNHARIEAAKALADWVVSGPTGLGSEHVLVLGDFNSYRMEDPIKAMREKGLVDLLSRFSEAAEYTFVYEGLGGTLDYIFSSPGLAARITGATAWHINADEPRALDFHDQAGKPAEYFTADAFRSSDHDPVIIGLDMGRAPADADQTAADPDNITFHTTLLAGALILLILGLSRMRLLRTRA